MDWIKKIIINTGLIVVSLFVVLLFAEMVLRFTPFVSLLSYEGMPQGYYVADRQGGYDIAQNFATSTHSFADGSYPIWSNELGCFDRPYGGEVPYVYLAGDSFTWGFAPFEAKWGTLLEEKLGIRTLKCGVPGYGTKQEVEKAREVLATLQSPKIIMLTYFNNDESDDAAYPNRLVYEGKLIKNMSGDRTLTYEQLEARLPQFEKWGREYCMWNEPANPAFQRVKCFLRQHSIVYLLTQQTVKALVPTGFLKNIGVVNQAPAFSAVPIEDMAHFNNLEQFKILADEKKSKLLVVLVATKESVDEEDDPYATQKAWLFEKKIPFLDLTSIFREESEQQVLFWQKDGHWNVEGNAVAAAAIAEFVEGHLIESQ